jgi:hypothetical protein
LTGVAQRSGEAVGEWVLPREPVVLRGVEIRRGCRRLRSSWAACCPERRSGLLLLLLFIGRWTVKLWVVVRVTSGLLVVGKGARLRGAVNARWLSFLLAGIPLLTGFSLQA